MVGRDDEGVVLSGWDGGGGVVWRRYRNHQERGGRKLAVWMEA